MVQIISDFTDLVTRNSTSLLILAVVFYFINTLYSFAGANDVVLLGNTALGTSNLIYLTDMGGIFAFLQAILASLVRLFAGLSFAAVCFDEEKNIYFRVVSVAALMMIMFGGLAIF